MRCPSGEGGIQVQVGSGSPLVICAGADGLGATITTLAAGDTHCPGGGAAVRIGSGAPAYACNGSLLWSTVAASGTAAANHGCIARSATPITLGLAESSTFEPDDRVKVLVDGAGSVRIAPRVGQSFRFSSQALSMPTGWSTTGAVTAGWNGLASSGDGSRLCRGNVSLVRRRRDLETERRD